MPTVFAVLRVLGWHGIIAAAVLIFYEGIPVVKSIPFIEYVPGIADLVSGRVDRAFDAGKLSERLEWQDKARRTEMKRDQERLAAQAEIDRIEAEYWAKQTDQAIRLSDLDKALQAERAEHEKIDAGACSRPISKRLRDQLAPLGR